MCVFVYAREFTCVRVCGCMCMHVCICLCALLCGYALCVYACARTHRCISMCVYIYMCYYVCMHVHVCALVYACSCVCAHVCMFLLIATINGKEKLFEKENLTKKAGMDVGPIWREEREERNVVILL